MSELYRCSNCGAPLDTTPDTIAVVCSYCGHLNWVRGDLREEVLIASPIDEEKALEKLVDFASRRGLGGVFRKANLTRATFIAVPFYFINASAEARYSGRVDVQVKRCRRYRDRERCWIDTRSVYVEGVYGPYASTVPVVARRGSDVASVKALASRYIGSRVEVVPLSRAELNRSMWGGVLSIEMDRGMAMDIALDTHLDRLREIVEEHMRREAERRVASRGGFVVGSRAVWRRITPVNVKITSSKPTLLPMYIASYRYGDGVYRAVLSGWDGEVVVLERPVKRLERILWWFAAAVVSGILGGAGLALFGIPAGAVLIIPGFAVSWYSMKRALSPVKSILPGSGAALYAKHIPHTRILDLLRGFPGGWRHH